MKAIIDTLNSTPVKWIELSEWTELKDHLWLLPVKPKSFNGLSTTVWAHSLLRKFSLRFQTHSITTSGMPPFGQAELRNISFHRHFNESGRMEVVIVMVGWNVNVMEGDSPNCFSTDHRHMIIALFLLQLHNY